MNQFKTAYQKCKTGGDLDRAIEKNLTSDEILKLAEALKVVDDYADLTYRDRFLMRTLEAIVKYQMTITVCRDNGSGKLDIYESPMIQKLKMYDEPTPVLVVTNPNKIEMVVKRFDDPDRQPAEYYELHAF
jgi:hypothetical protein